METNKKDYQLGSKVIMKKQHPCGANEWEIIRLGADIKIKCLNLLLKIKKTRSYSNKCEIQLVMFPSLCRNATTRLCQLSLIC